MNARIALPLSFLLLFVACDRNAANRHASLDEAAPTPQETRATAEPLQITIKDLVATPDTVFICKRRKDLTALLRWNVSDSGATGIVLTVFDPRQGEEKRFGRGGPSGTKQTGPWLRPGLVFRVRNQADNTELGKVAIEGRTCP
jgi:hypothetical protein